MKRILIITFIAFICMPAMAQLNFGARAGLTAFKLTEKEAFQDSDIGLGLLLGGCLRYGDHLFIQPEVNWTRKVTEVTTTEVVFDESATDKLGFYTLQVPVMVGYKLFSSTDGTSSVRLMAGPSFDFLLQMSDNDLKLSRGDFSTANIGIDAGLGLDLWFLTVDLRYGFGLTQFLDVDNDLRSRTVTLSAGVIL